MLLALYCGQRAIAEKLALHKKDLDIFEAAAIGDVEHVRALLDCDESLRNSFSDDGFHPLALAAAFANPRVVEELVRRGADLRLFTKNENAKVAPIHSAAFGNDQECVRILLDAGVEPDMRAEGFTALHSAAQNGNREMVMLLLERGADKNTSTNDGRSPADLARDPGHEPSSLGL